MQLLTYDRILASLDSKDAESLYLDPLLNRDQVGSISVDLRLGYDFTVSILTRRSAIEPYPAENIRKRGIPSYFQETRRRLGERFILYPHQVVLTTTVEYLSLPKNIYAAISIRSSYGRLGIGVTTIMQPGWRGTIPLELFNHGNTPIEMVVGSCVCQAMFYEIEQSMDYVRVGSTRKYFGTVRPSVSKADHDDELAQLAQMGNIF